MTAVSTAPLYDALVEELGDVPQEVRTAADGLLRELERETGLTRAALGAPPEGGTWFG